MPKESRRDNKIKVIGNYESKIKITWEINTHP